MLLRLIDLEAARKQEVVSALKALLMAAEDGHVAGLVYVIDIAGTPRVGASGTYRRSPEKALQATLVMEKSLCSSGPFAESG